MQNSAYLAPKPRYEILDGLRGVAALFVVAYHLFETYSRTMPPALVSWDIRGWGETNSVNGPTWSGMAYACLKLYDEPVREWLRKHWLMKKQVRIS